MTDQVASPLTGKPAELSFKVPVTQVCDLYRTEYSIDIRPFLGENLRSNAICAKILV